jgi:uncharacterized cupredoxin-like copper-binding protein
MKNRPKTAGKKLALQALAIQTEKLAKKTGYTLRHANGNETELDTDATVTARIKAINHVLETQEVSRSLALRHQRKRHIAWWETK